MGKRGSERTTEERLKLQETANEGSDEHFGYPTAILLLLQLQRSYNISSILVGMLCYLFMYYGLLGS